jgi:hypothetical protein
MALALAAVALATPAHGVTTEEVGPDDLGPEASTFVIDMGEPGDEFEEECFEEEEELEEAEAVEEEVEEAAEECEAEAQDATVPPEECVLQTARARVSTDSAHGKVRLVLHYTALAPTAVTIEYRLRGNKGSLRLGQASRHFGQRGVFRASETVGENQMARVRAAKSFEVQLHVAGAPAFCAQYYSRHLTERHGGNKHAVWSESDRPAI